MFNKYVLKFRECVPEDKKKKQTFLWILDRKYFVVEIMNTNTVVSNNDFI